MENKLTLFILLIGIGMIVLSQCLYIVDEREQVILLRFGQPVGDIKQPGLHVKIPLYHTTERFERRILPLDPDPEQIVISSEDRKLASIVPEDEETSLADEFAGSGEPIIVDTFARYQITDPLKFLKTLRNLSNATSRLESMLSDSTKTVMGTVSLVDLLSPKRTQIMKEILESMNRKTAESDLGVEIIDVRVIRTDLNDNLLQSTVRRMNSELQERASETRARGEEEAIRISSTAEKEREVIIAEAERDAKIIRGEGDKEAITIYAQAFNKDKDFYAFLRSMEAYKETLSRQDTKIILSPESDFLRYFKDKAQD